MVKFSSHTWRGILVSAFLLTFGYKNGNKKKYSMSVKNVKN